MSNRDDSGAHRPLSGKELTIGVLTALVVFGFIGIATLGSGNVIVRTILVGPYGISAAIWFFAIGSWLSFRVHRNRSRE